ncbi:MAG: CHAT domain-containing protein [Acidobacteriota bacterium]
MKTRVIWPRLASGRGRRRLLLIAVSSLVLASCQAPEAPKVLPFDTPSEDFIEHGTTIELELELTEDQVVELVAEQQDVDLTLKLLSPAAKALLEIDSPTDLCEAERLFWVAREAGRHRLQLIAGQGKQHQGPTTGRFRITTRPLRPAQPQDREMAELALTQTTWWSRHENRLQEAEELSRIARRWEDLSRPAEAALAWRMAGDKIRLARQSTDKNMLPSAPEHQAYQKALNGYERANDSTAQIKMLDQIGLLLAKTSDLDALPSYQRAIAIDSRCGPALASAHNNLALSQKRSGRFSGALDNYRRALAAFHPLNLRHRALTLKNLGELEVTIGDYPQALQRITDSIALRRKVLEDDPNPEAARDLAKALIALSKAHRRLDNLEAADRSLTEAIDIARGPDSQKDEAIALNARGSLAFQKEDYQAAWTDFHAANELFSDLQDSTNQRWARINLAWTAGRLGRLAEAEQLIQQVLAEDPSLRLRQRASALRVLAEIRDRQGRLDDAIEVIEQALSWVETLRRAPSGDRLRTQFRASKDDYFKIAIDLYIQRAQRGDQSDLRRAFELSDQGKARNLIERMRMRLDDIPSDLPPELLREQRRIEERIRRLHQRSPNGGRDELPMLYAEQDQVRGRLRAANPAFAELVNPRAVDLRALQAVLSEDTLLLDFSLAGRETFVFWVGSQALGGKRLAVTRDQVEEWARKLRDAFDRPSSEPHKLRGDRALEAIAKALFEPIEAQLAGKSRLLLVLDGALHHVPFALLPQPADGRLMIESFQIERTPSASTLLLPRPPRKLEETPRRALLLAPFGGPPEPWMAALGTLPASQSEVEAIAEHFPPEQQTLAFGEAARRHWLETPEAAHFDLIHLASHAIIRPEALERSGIFFAPEGSLDADLLDVHAIFELRLTADLVTLSTCQSALGRELPGEGLRGMTQAFFSAGAERLVASLWSVRDDATATLMTRLYAGYLGEEMSAAAALRQAQLSMLEDPAVEHRDWAAFVPFTRSP